MTALQAPRSVTIVSSPSSECGVPALCAGTVTRQTAVAVAPRLGAASPMNFFACRW
jgi:hypothetical protein